MDFFIKKVDDYHLIKYIYYRRNNMTAPKNCPSCGTALVIHDGAGDVIVHDCPACVYQFVERPSAEKPKTSHKADFADLFGRAYQAGMEALRKMVPVPMTVQRHENQLDDTSRVVQEWFVEDGVCGFAWVNVTPGTSAFAKWLKTTDRAHKSYYGGVDVWISEGNQSMQKKEAFAHAFAKVLNDAGIKAYTMSRMD